MWSLIVLPLLAAGIAAMLAWHHATELDRQQSEGWSQEARRDRNALPLALGAQIAAIAATSFLQLVLLSNLAPH